MKIFISLFLIGLSSLSAMAKRPSSYTELLPYVQPAPDQGETNTCWFVASTGAMELLLNKRDGIRYPRANSKNDLSESFIIWQKDFVDEETSGQQFLETIVLRFNHGEAVLNKYWPFVSHNEDGTDNYDVWNKRLDFETIPRIKVPPVSTTMLFQKGKRWATDVLEEEDLELIKTEMSKHRAPIIVNYNDDHYWHVVLLVGYDDKKRGDCYELEAVECKTKGIFYVRDSDGKRFEARSYSWFLKKGNAAALVELKKKTSAVQTN